MRSICYEAGSKLFLLKFKVKEVKKGLCFIDIIFDWPVLMFCSRLVIPQSKLYGIRCSHIMLTSLNI